MIDLEQLYTLIDSLPREALDQLEQYIQQRRQTAVWVVSPAQLKTIETLLKSVHDSISHIPDAEIEAVLDEALDEVRRERKTQSRH
jgi:hypothetical protein